MDESARASFLQSQAACAILEAFAMQVENQEARSNVKSVNGPQDFRALIERYGLGHNSALQFLQGR